MSQELVSHIQALVGDVNVDLDAPLNDEDEWPCRNNLMLSSTDRLNMFAKKQPKIEHQWTNLVC